MFDPNYLILIPALPLAAAALIAAAGPRLRERSHWPCVLAVAASCVLSVLLLLSVQDGNKELHRVYTWFQTGATPADPGYADVGVTLRADGLTAVMLVTVTFIGTLIAVYSSGYMHGDPGYPRFFFAVSLFIFSMTGLVLANNFLLLYAFWEGVGLCSYLLIGFWFTKPSAAAAARKAFLVTRLGDVGFFLGILTIWLLFGHNLDFHHVLSEKTIQGADPWVLTLVCLLLFCGAVGKSAQFPLHVWLPDAMEGPTPVSALIHAATMVTAGVYLVARCTPLFAASEEARLVVACTGAFTALLAALIGLTQNDLKRVLAYSTVSQLGFMFLALGSGAVVAAVFHLFTHAFFKALLFLGSGSVMHAMGGVIDMRRFSGLKKVMPTTHATFLVGSLALAGFPLLAGFWSKDEILVGTFAARHGRYPILYTALLIVALVTAGLTAFYTFRAYFKTFWGEERIPEEAGHHAHESPASMTGPLVILAAGAALAGFVNAEPLTHWLGHFLTEQTPQLHAAGHAEVAAVDKMLVMLGGTLMALGGIAVAWFLYVAQPGAADKLAAPLQTFYQASLNRFFFDELYTVFVVNPVLGLAQLARWFDTFVVDRLIDLAAQIPRGFGHLFRPIQNGLAQFYALAMAAGLVVFLIALLWRSASGAP